MRGLRESGAYASSTMRNLASVPLLRVMSAGERIRCRSRRSEKGTGRVKARPVPFSLAPGRRRRKRAKEVCVRIGSLLIIALAAQGFGPSSARADDAAKPDFARDVLPILKTHCFQCHDRNKGTSGLRLDVRAR